MTKKELYETVSSEVSSILENTEISENVKNELQAVIDNYLKPKSGGGSQLNPPLKDDEGNITHYWCRLHQMYEPVEDMVISNGKSKGYCKASISKWNKANSKIKKLEAEATSLLLDGKPEEAMTKANEAKELKAVFNSPSYYDYVEDWTVFSKADTEEAIEAIEEKYNELKEL
jgi:hypothetical protein